MIEYIKSLIEEYKNMDEAERFQCNNLMFLIITLIVSFIIFFIKYGV